MNEYMKIADELAKENLKTNAGGPFGACIVKDASWGRAQTMCLKITTRRLMPRSQR